MDRLSELYQKADTGYSMMAQASRPKLAQWEQWCAPNGSEIALLWPLTYMNLSGQAVGFLASQLGKPTDGMLVVVDDMSLPLGQVRLRQKGSSGGHNGLKSLEALLGHQDYPRLRLGIGAPVAGDEVIDFVLSPFDLNELAAVKQVVEFSAHAAAEWAEGVSFDRLVGKVNGWRWEPNP